MEGGDKKSTKSRDVIYGRPPKGQHENLKIAAEKRQKSFFFFSSMAHNIPLAFEQKYLYVLSKTRIKSLVVIDI